MRWSQRAFLGFGAMALAVGAAPPPAAGPDPVEQKVVRIRDAFVAATRRCGVKLRFEPAVAIVTEPSVISYDGKRRTLIIGRYAALPPPIKAFLGAWAAHDMPGSSGEELFDTLFNGFLVGHELGHWIGDQSGRLDTLDHYEAELEANRFAIAFASFGDRSGAAAGAMVKRFSYLATLPNPVPAGQDERRYFDEQYDAMPEQHPLAYNWFQGRLMQEAWARRGQASFCDLAKLPPLARAG